MSFLFADDKAALYNNNNVDNNLVNIQNDLTTLNTYFLSNYLIINPIKTKIVHFRAYQKIINPTKLVQLNDHQIEVVPNVNYLGLIIDQFLSWHSHITQLCKKVSMVGGTLFKLKRVLPVDTLK